MLKSKGFLFCASVALSGVLANAAYITYETPAQASDGCYEISTAGELYGFSSLVNSYTTANPFTGCAKLTKDIVVNENVLTADGELNSSASSDFVTWNPLMRYAGTFDGQGHTISGLYVDRNSGNAGFIGTIEGVAGTPKMVVVKNLGVLDSYFQGSYNNGSIVGIVSYDAWPVLIENCYSNSRVVSTISHAGGILGYAHSTVIRNCYNLGTISGPEGVGGIVGYTERGNNTTLVNTLVNVFNRGKVTATSKPIYGKPILGQAKAPTIHENVFYLSDILEEGDIDTMGVAMSQEQFEKGAVVYLLRNYAYEGMDATIWGQKIGTDKYPTFSGTLTGSPEISLQTLTLHTYTGDTNSYAPKYAPGYAFRLPIPHRAGYTFHGWFNNAELTGDSIDFIPATATGTQEFWARYKKAWTITYKVDGGTIDSFLVESYTEGIGAALPKYVSRDGYVFSGWYASSDFSGHAVDSIRTSDTGDKTFYAKWFKKEFPKQDTNGCYEISSAAELYGFSALVKGTDGLKTPQTRACGKLTKDIVVNKIAFAEDGSFDETNMTDYVPWNPIDSFAGRFDGQGHTVSGLFVFDTVHYGMVYNGLFGSIGAIEDRDTVVVKNVGLEKSYMRARNLIGGIVAAVRFFGKDGAIIIENCYNAATLHGTFTSLGGVVGSVSGYSPAFIVNCYNVGNVYSLSNVGGIVGINYRDARTHVVNCMSIGPVKSGNKSYGRALVDGTKGDSLIIVNSYYLSTLAHNEYGGYSVTAEQVRNGALAYALRYGTYGAYNGLVWGQNVGTDAHPVLSGEFKNSEAIPYSVTFNTFVGDTAEYFDAYMPGIERPLPDTVVMKKGEFLGWYDNAGFSGNAVTVIPKGATGDQEFWAKINKISDVTLVLNGGKVDSGNVATYTEGVGAQLPWRVSRDSNIFAGWYDNAEFSGKAVAKITTEDTGDKTYYAKWFKMKMPEKDPVDTCYAISDAAELYGFAAFVGRKHGMSNRQNSNACGKLTKDIVINQGVLKDGVLDSANMTSFLQWEPILAFGGDFFGNGHKISGLYISRDSTAQGFIATANTRNDKDYNQIPVVVRDVVFEDAYIRGTGEVGGVFADVSSYRIISLTNVRFEGHVETLPNVNGAIAGGLVGSTFATLYMDSCVNVASVSGMSAAGLVGKIVDNMVISNSANLGTITGGKNGAAGLVGSTLLSYSSTITNSYNAGTVTSTGTSAGLYNSPHSTSLTISNSYNAGEIVGAGSAAGLVGGAETVLSAIPLRRNHLICAE